MQYFDLIVLSLNLKHDFALHLIKYQVLLCKMNQLTSLSEAFVPRLPQCLFVCSFVRFDVVARSALKSSIKRAEYSK